MNIKKPEVFREDKYNKPDYWQIHKKRVESLTENLNDILEDKPFTDTHIHLYPPKLFNAIFNWFDWAGWVIPYKKDTDSLYKYLELAGIKRSFLLLYAHKPDISYSLNKWAKDFCIDKMLLPFGCIHPGDKDLDRILGEVLDNWSFPGIKLHLLVQKIRADDSSLSPVYEALNKRDKCLIIHAGTCPYPESHLSIDYLYNVLKKFPYLRVQIAHLGLYELDKSYYLAKNYENVYLDTSFILGNPAFPLGNYMEKILDLEDKIVYGSDFPLIKHDMVKGIEKILELELDKDFYQKLFSTNATKFLGS
ncbi:amidohydrolase family protein [Natranaerofaba carboxydovora]|uniref:amidohydrolase family protein n=1 Tax=Natranaerofaba carboxydovora TaxID=2742683 RepID=UPI001F14698A|nr:amidohydrolase family protein [Natranaerofaba carboxydovora]UMZ74599.1 Amidohydrolase [Natranaerofaba carboxydovora]